MPDTPAVLVDSLTRCFGSRIALDAVSFDVASGCLLALLGPNGSGKTTLFSILTTMLAPTSGRAEIEGFDVSSRPDAVRRCIGVVFQHPALDRRLTVRENLRHHGHLYGLSGAALNRRITDWMNRLAVADRADDLVDKLSGGLRRRAELAKALLHQPRILILDEPSSGLDPAARLSLMESLRELTRDGVTVLLTTHLMEEADRCDQVAVLDRGKLVAHDTPDSLKRSIGGDVLTLKTKNPVELAKQLSERFHVPAEAWDGTVRLEHPRGHELLAGILGSFAREIESVTVGKPTIEDVFVHLTGRRLTDSVSLVLRP